MLVCCLRPRGPLAALWSAPWVPVGVSWVDYVLPGWAGACLCALGVGAASCGGCGVVLGARAAARCPAQFPLFLASGLVAVVSVTTSSGRWFGLWSL